MVSAPSIQISNGSCLHLKECVGFGCCSVLGILDTSLIKNSSYGPSWHFKDELQKSINIMNDKILI